VLTEVEPSVAVVADDHGGDAGTAAGRRTLTLKAGAVAELSARPAAHVVLDQADGGDLAAVVFTSGTTGTPRGAMLTHANLLAGAEVVRLAWRLSEDDGLVLALPWFHVHGLGLGVNGGLLAGARLLVLPRFDAPATLDACERPHATVFFGVPTMYARLAEEMRQSPPRAAAAASLRLMVSGSAPLPASLWETTRALCGQRVLERYGMTETMITVSNPYDGERRPGSIGLPLPGIETALMGDTNVDGNVAEGELLVRGPTVFAGYWRRPEDRGAVIDARGWMHTGDVVRRDPDGYLRVCGRRRELIITGGHNVHPREVEEVLELHPAVAEAAVAGRPSAEWGEEVVAHVVPADAAAPPSRQELDQWCRDRLAPYKRPRQLVVAERLPRNRMGKLQRSRLR
jgi:malonyl-CoA/methylmalonyl-CoA synthetase